MFVYHAEGYLSTNNYGMDFGICAQHWVLLLQSGFAIWRAWMRSLLSLSKFCLNSEYMLMQLYIENYIQKV